MSMSRKAFTAAVCGAITAALCIVSAPASARPVSAPESFTMLTSGPLHVTTTSGKHLMLSLEAIRLASGSGGSNAHRPSKLLVTLRGNGGHESHQWTFHLTANSFTDTAGGNGSLKTVGQIAPYGRLSLTISPLSNATTHVCDNHNRQITHHVAVKGALAFRTHSAGANSWGALSDHSIEFTHGTLSAGHGPDVEEACARIPCQAGLLWTASHGSIDLNGVDVAAKGKPAHARIEANRVTHLSPPAHASRVDTVIVGSPAPSLTSSGGHKLLHATSAGGIATGSATLTSTSRSPFHQDCVTGQMSGVLWNASYVADGTPLTVHEQIFGPMTIASDKHADFIKVHIN